ncbi:MAG TPA: hypothetical protein VGL99_08340 [Chloroflexota bacterium]
MSRASVQALRLGLEAIQRNVLRVADGEYRAVVEVNGGTSLLDVDQRQEAILAGFGAFLNALSFPVQIVVRSAPVDLARYVTALEERARQSSTGALASLAHDHAAFIQSLARQRTLVERRFYVVVPAESARRGRWSHWLMSRSDAHASPAAEAAERQLAHRCDELAHQLARCDLHVRRLSDLELAQLFLACWSPERGRVQRFRQRLDAYTSLAVRTSTRALARVAVE